MSEPEYRAYSSATLFDVGGRRFAMDRAIKPLLHGMTLFGPAYTIRCEIGDNRALHLALQDDVRDRVLVVGTSGGEERSYLGELITLAAQRSGALGIILDGFVRDVDQIREIGFPVFCRGAAHVGAIKKSDGEREESIQCGGLTIAAGQYVSADGDGVVTVEAGRESEIFSLAELSLRREQRVRELIQDGAKLHDALFTASKGGIQK